MFELLLFTTDVPLAQRAIAAGVDGIVIDWEYRGKERRQQGADTQINRDTPEDLARIRGIPGARTIVRVNAGFGLATREEIDTAIDLGAHEILLPMVETPGQVEQCLSHVAGRADLSILIETTAAVACARQLGALPLRRIYVGLNDLMIQRRAPSIFEPLVDGTLDALRPHIHAPFGFGGLTLPTRGHPVPCRLLMGELMRLGATHSFLRRSFLADTAGENLGPAFGQMRAALALAAQRTADEVAHDHRQLAGIIAPAQATVEISPLLRPLQSQSALPRQSASAPAQS